MSPLECTSLPIVNAAPPIAELTPIPSESFAAHRGGVSVAEEVRRQGGAPLRREQEAWRQEMWLAMLFSPTHALVLTCDVYFPNEVCRQQHLI